MATVPTDLSISGVGFPPYSARGLTQTLVPISAAANNRRDINGVLHDLSDSSFRKYESVISAEDQQPPAIDGIWPGLQVTVDCIVELAVPSDNPTTTETESLTEAELGRTPVPGSVRQEGAYIFYRPRLTMRIANFQTDKDEWGATVGWTMVLEEV